MLPDFLLVYISIYAQRDALQPANEHCLFDYQRRVCNSASEIFRAAAWGSRQPGGHYTYGRTGSVVCGSNFWVRRAMLYTGQSLASRGCLYCADRNIAIWVGSHGLQAMWYIFLVSSSC